MDSSQGVVTIRGWQEATTVTAVEAARALEPFCDEFLYTNVDTEGLMQGIPMDAVRAVREATSRRVVAAGGITTQEEIDELDAMGVDAVVGMAIYTAPAWQPGIATNVGPQSITTAAAGIRQTGVVAGHRSLALPFGGRVVLLRFRRMPLPRGVAPSRWWRCSACCRGLRRADRFNVQNARAHVERLTAAGSRWTGTPANEKARAYLIETLQLYGLRGAGPGSRTRVARGRRHDPRRQHHRHQARAAAGGHRARLALRLGGVGTRRR